MFVKSAPSFLWMIFIPSLCCVRQFGKAHPCRNTTGNFCCPFLCSAQPTTHLSASLRLFRVVVVVVNHEHRPGEVATDTAFGKLSWTRDEYKRRQQQGLLHWWTWMALAMGVKFRTVGLFLVQALWGRSLYMYFNSSSGISHFPRRIFTYLYGRNARSFWGTNQSTWTVSWIAEF
jgi:hypothetical protein